MGTNRQQQQIYKRIYTIDKHVYSITLFVHTIHSKMLEYNVTLCTHDAKKNPREFFPRWHGSETNTQ